MFHSLQHCGSRSKYDWNLAPCSAGISLCAFYRRCVAVRGGGLNADDVKYTICFVAFAVVPILAVPYQSVFAVLQCHLLFVRTPIHFRLILLRLVERSRPQLAPYWRPPRLALEKLLAVRWGPSWYLNSFSKYVMDDHVYRYGHYWCELLNGCLPVVFCQFRQLWNETVRQWLCVWTRLIEHKRCQTLKIKVATWRVLLTCL